MSSVRLLNLALCIEGVKVGGVAEKRGGEVGSSRASSTETCELAPWYNSHHLSLFS